MKRYLNNFKVFFINFFFLCLCLDASAEVSLDLSFQGRNFFGGQRIRQEVVFVNPEDKEKEGILKWATLIEQGVIQKGENNVRLLPNQKNKIEAELIFPLVERRVPLYWKLQFFCKDKLEAEKTVSFSLFPEVDFYRLKNTFVQEKLGLFDPEGNLKTILKEIPFDELTNQLSLEFFEGKVIIFSLSDFEKEEKNLTLLERKAKEGTTVILLVKGSQNIKNAEVLALGHPAFFGLEEEDFQNWQGDIASYFFSFPKGNFTILLSSENKPLLLEKVSGKGRIIFCALDLANIKEPVASSLVFNLLSYCLISPSPLAPDSIFLFASLDSKITKLLEQLKVKFTLNPSDLNFFRQGIIFGEDLIPFKKEAVFHQLKAFIHKGGNIVILNPQLQDIDFFKSIISTPMGLIHGKINNIIKKKDPLLWGISKEKLVQSKYELIFKESNFSYALTSPPVAAIFLEGRGKVIFLQMPLQKEEGIVSLMQILTNLGIALG